MGQTPQCLLFYGAPSWRLSQETEDDIEKDNTTSQVISLPDPTIALTGSYIISPLEVSAQEISEVDEVLVNLD